MENLKLFSGIISLAIAGISIVRLNNRNLPVDYQFIFDNIYM